MILAVIAIVAGLAIGLAVVSRAPALHGAPTERELVVLAGTAAALAAAFSDAAPTGWVVLDVVGRAGLGGACVLLGARAGFVPVLLTTAGGAAVAAGSSLQPLALAVTGVMVVTMLIWREAPRVTAVAAGVMAQVALHLHEPRAAGATAVAAALVLAPTLAAGAAQLSADTRRRLLRVGMTVVVFAVPASALGLASALTARHSLEEGLAASRGSLAAVQRADATLVTTQLDAADRAFEHAQGRLLGWWARPAWLVPVVGQNLRTLRSAAAEGRRLAASGRLLASAELDSIRPRGGRVSLDELRAATAPVHRTAERLAAAHRRLRATRSAWLLPPLKHHLDRALGQLASADDAADDASRVLRELPALLGGEGFRRYFLVVQTPAELRASGGFFGNFGEITADHGQLTLARVGAVQDLNDGSDPRSRRLVGPPDYLSRYDRFAPERFWQNVNVSPDFPTVASVIANLYPQSGGAPVDGVLAVDPAGLATLLRVTGPVQLPELDEPITAENAESILLHRHYIHLAGREDARQEFLGGVARAVWNRLTTGPLPGAREILSTLAPAVRGKHFMVTSVRPHEERLFEDVNAAGKMAPVQDDFLAVVTQAASANKIDYFLRRRFDYQVTLDPDSGELRASLVVVLQNLAPRTGLPAVVIGGEARPPIPVGDNRVYLSVYTPWALEDARIDDKAVSFEADNELGRRVYSSFVVVPSQGSLTVRLELSGRRGVDSRYRLDVHRQGTVVPDDVTTTLALERGQVAGGEPRSTEQFLLAEDRVVERSLDW